MVESPASLRPFLFERVVDVVVVVVVSVLLDLLPLLSLLMMLLMSRVFSFKFQSYIGNINI